MENRIREVRNAQEKTLEWLASELDTTPRTIQRFETGERNVSLAWLKRIAKALKTPVSELVSENSGSPKAQSKADRVATEISIACVASLNALVKSKKMPEKMTNTAIEKSIKYFWDDFVQGTPPSQAQIKKFMMSLIE